jgi:hypothetical protein
MEAIIVTLLAQFNYAITVKAKARYSKIAEIAMEEEKYIVLIAMEHTSGNAAHAMVLEPPYHISQQRSVENVHTVMA